PGSEADEVHAAKVNTYRRPVAPPPAAYAAPTAPATAAAAPAASLLVDKCVCPQHVGAQGGTVILRDTAATITQALAPLTSQPPPPSARQSWLSAPPALRQFTHQSPRQGDPLGMPVTVIQPSPHAGTRPHPLRRRAKSATLGL